jgi:transglutaminase-like putative cysteine protease
MPQSAQPVTDDPSAYLDPTWFIDWDKPRVAEAAERAAGDAVDESEIVARLYRAVRDGIRYNPYAMRLDAESFRASDALASGGTWCVPKAVLLAAVARSRGVPARVGFADVRNHLSTDKLASRMGKDVFIWHGYCQLYVDGKWVKATPAFNAELCARFGVPPLEFDGTRDALMHAFDGAGSQFMEYLNDRGPFTDVPYDRLMSDFHDYYPGMVEAIREGAVGEEADAFAP